MTLAVWPLIGPHSDHAKQQCGTLKSNLSGYLEAVKNGKEIIVTSHRHPIARLIPVGKLDSEILEIIPAKNRFLR